MRKTVLGLIVSLVTVLCWAAGSLAADSGSIIAVAGSGIAAPGGGTYEALGSPSLSPDGEFTFTANVGGQIALFAASAKSSRRIAESGDAAPGGGTLALSLMGNSPPDINVRGDVVLRANLIDGSEGIFIFSKNGKGKCIARSGDPAPGGGVFQDFIPADDNPISLAAINTSGAVAFLGRVAQGSDVKTGIYLWRKRRGIRVVAEGDDLGSFALDDRSVVFFAQDGDIFKRTRRGIRTVVQVNDPAPGGGMFSSLRFTHSMLNRRGLLLVIATVSEPGESDREGLYLVSHRGIHPVALEGDYAPGGGNYSQFVNAGLNNRGSAAFLAVVENHPGFGTGPAIFSVASLRDEGRVVISKGDALPPGGDVNFFPGYAPIAENGVVGFVVVTTNWQEFLFLATPPRGRHHASKPVSGMQALAVANFPNPANPSTTIRYTLPEDSDVRLVIYNLLGQQVRTLVDQEKTVGAYTVQWDGRDASGRAVGTGVYLYRLEAGKFQSVQKLMLLK